MTQQSSFFVSQLSFEFIESWVLFPLPTTHCFQARRRAPKNLSSTLRILRASSRKVVQSSHKAVRATVGVLSQVFYLHSPYFQRSLFT